LARSTIAVVEDEPAIRGAVAQALRLSGYQVVEAGDGESGLACAVRHEVDLLLLDLMLPRLDGLTVLARLRAVRPGCPVIILTAKGAEEDIVRGLRDGADDYMVKPFGARELLARVEAVLRRSPARPQPVSALRLGRWQVDFERRELCDQEGRRRTLTEAEAAILSFLAEQPQRAVSREELLGRLWGLLGSRVESRTVDMHIARLRSKLEEKEGAPRLILTARGKGYMLGGRD